MTEEKKNNQQQPEKASEVNKEVDERSKLVAHIREKSNKGEIVKYKELYEEPFSYQEESLKEILGEIKNNEEYDDIHILKGTKGYYLYSDQVMKGHYALILAKMEDKDNPGLIAEMVRKDSRTYPRPTDAKTFYGFPFFMSEEDLEDVLEDMKKHPDYQDINEVFASDGSRFLFSSEHMKERRAKLLAEQEAVDRVNFP
ncbi:hypothetical protein [Natranaerofaba carboxydovora]|uniref:hypothetical protein n=1 Tax=Natranaerofaba carboxydovora TaxID=2742683 RepID=UPI001F12F25D|nr:hypothetical protein [Natranaerofaba carboxydovora]UMZ72903.1 hypothetical protein ACONDI_00441 [Natranaerofaba carboxydovora]